MRPFALGPAVSGGAPPGAARAVRARTTRTGRKRTTEPPLRYRSRVRNGCARHPHVRLHAGPVPRPHGRGNREARPRCLGCARGHRRYARLTAWGLRGPNEVEAVTGEPRRDLLAPAKRETVG